MLHVEGRFFITGTPMPRDWMANLRVDPRIVVHVKQGVHADVSGQAIEVDDEELRRWVFARFSDADRVALEREVLLGG